VLFDRRSNRKIYCRSSIEQLPQGAARIQLPQAQADSGDRPRGIGGSCFASSSLTARVLCSEPFVCCHVSASAIIPVATSNTWRMIELMIELGFFSFVCERGLQFLLNLIVQHRWSQKARRCDASQAARTRCSYGSAGSA